jgi:hypothetical protein
MVRAGHTSISNHGAIWKSPSTCAYPDSMTFHCPGITHRKRLIAKRNNPITIYAMGVEK